MCGRRNPGSFAVVTICEVEARLQFTYWRVLNFLSFSLSVSLIVVQSNPVEVTRRFRPPALLYFSAEVGTGFLFRFVLNRAAFVWFDKVLYS